MEGLGPLRIIAGSAKKRLLKVPSGWQGRPTADRVKEALFSILGDWVPDAKFLDLFAGTGSIGIEALSRGAQSAVFVENDPRAFKAILQNVEDSKLQEGSRVIKKDVYRALHELSPEDFDIVFMDPPYDKGYEVPVITKVIELGLLIQGGMIIAESSKREELPPQIMNFRLVRQQRYGDTLLSFYR